MSGQPVRIVQAVLGIHVVVQRPVTVAGHLQSRLGEPSEHGIGAQLRLLLFQPVRERVTGNPRKAYLPLTREAYLPLMMRSWSSVAEYGTVNSLQN